MVTIRNWTLSLSVSVKRKLLLTCSLLFSFLSAVLGQTSKQIVICNDLGIKAGKVYIAWYNKKDDFLNNDKIYLGKSGEINEQGSATVIFENMASGVYAIAAFADENGNGKLDTNFFGIPKEKYGFSNNVRPMMRAATFKEASFTVTNNNSTISIQLK